MIDGFRITILTSIFPNPQWAIMYSLKDGAHYCYCTHFLRMPRKSRVILKEMHNTQDTQTGFVSCK